MTEVLPIPSSCTLFCLGVPFLPLSQWAPCTWGLFFSLILYSPLPVHIGGHRLFRSSKISSPGRCTLFHFLFFLRVEVTIINNFFEWPGGFAISFVTIPYRLTLLALPIFSAIVGVGFIFGSYLPRVVHGTTDLAVADPLCLLWISAVAAFPCFFCLSLIGKSLGDLPICK